MAVTPPPGKPPAGGVSRRFTPKIPPRLPHEEARSVPHHSPGQGFVLRVKRRRDEDPVDCLLVPERAPKRPSTLVDIMGALNMDMSASKECLLLLTRFVSLDLLKPGLGFWVSPSDLYEI